MATKNPYDLLGVKATATDKEIRSAYRKLAKKLHPDVNPDDPASAERFKEVTAAYNLLSNEELRKQYDSGQIDEQGQQRNPFAGGFGQRGGQQAYSTGFGGFEGFGGARGPGGGQMGQDDMSDLFGSLFGMNMGGARRGGMNRPPMARKGADVRYKLRISFVDSLKGTTRELYGGTKVRIPAGVKDGQTLRLKGKGEAGVNGGPAGDAKVKVNVGSHKHLTRDGNDLHLRLPISLREALEGAKIRLDMPSGAVSFSVKPGSNSGKKLRLKGKGVAGKGNLLIELVVTLTDAELAASEAVLADLPEAGGETLRSGLL